MSISATNGDFILASASPRRRHLLRQVGLCFRVVPSKMKESNETVMEPWRHALYHAAAKANEVAQRYPEDWVLAADTIVVLGREILGKPTDPADAMAMLTRLSGQSHSVITGVCLTCGHEALEERVWVETTVFMKRLSSEELQGYLDTGEPMDKAGGYGIQGIGGCLIHRIEGSYSNVVGLPLYEAVELLRRHLVADPFRK